MRGTLGRRPALGAPRKAPQGGAPFQGVLREGPAGTFSAVEPAPAAGAPAPAQAPTSWGAWGDLAQSMRRSGIPLGSADWTAIVAEGTKAVTAITTTAIEASAKKKSSRKRASSKASAAPAPAPVESTFPTWLPIAGVAGVGALVLVLVLRQRSAAPPVMYAPPVRANPPRRHRRAS